MKYKIANRTDCSELVTAADGDSVMIMPKHWAWVDEKFIKWQSPDPKIFRILQVMNDDGVMTMHDIHNRTPVVVNVASANPITSVVSANVVPAAQKNVSVENSKD